MKPEVDAIVAAIPPPGKLKGGGDAEPDPGDASGDDYNPEEDAAMGVAEALGVPADKVDASALAEALRSFVSVAKG